MLYTPSWDKTATKQVVTDDMIARIRDGERGREFYRNGFDGSVLIDDMISNSRQCHAVWPDGDIWKAGSNPRPFTSRQTGTS